MTKLNKSLLFRVATLSVVCRWIYNTVLRTLECLVQVLIVNCVIAGFIEFMMSAMLIKR